MISKKLLFIPLIVSFVFSCASYPVKKKTVDEKKYFTSSGFALVYDETLYKDKIINKKIDNASLNVLHNSLRRNTYIKIFNPINSKVVETKVTKKTNYPKIFNIVISKKIATLLELDLNNPFVEIHEVKKNETFIAKEGSMFDEEKNVAEKAPVDEIKMDDITKDKKEAKKNIKKKYNFILVVSDFYFEDSARDLKNELTVKTKINNLQVKKINDKKYRLFVGPFKNFNALKTAYISLNNLGFENLNIYRQ